MWVGLMPTVRLGRREIPVQNTEFLTGVKGFLAGSGCLSIVGFGRSRERSALRLLIFPGRLVLGLDALADFVVAACADRFRRVSGSIS